jgi:hypothetical protein
VDMHATDLVGINGITRGLSVYTCLQPWRPRTVPSTPNFTNTIYTVILKLKCLLCITLLQNVFGKITIALVPNAISARNKRFPLKKMFCLDNCSCGTFRFTMCHSWHTCHVLYTTDLYEIWYEWHAVEYYF